MTETEGKRKRLFWGAYLLLMAALVYWAYGFFAREIYDYILWNKLVEDIDHRHKPNEKKDINSDGIRSFREATDFSPEKTSVVFAGDSFVFGHLLKARQTVPHQFEQLARQKTGNKQLITANFGWTSSSPLLSLRLLKDIGKKYNPDTVIFLLDMTDYKDDFFYSNVINKTGNYALLIDRPVLGHVIRKLARSTDSYTGWQQQLLGYPDFSIYFVAHQPYEQSLPYFENTWQNLLDMNEFVRGELNARFIVFVPPRHWQYTDRESPLSWEKHNYTAMGPHVLNNFHFIDEKAPQAPFPVVSLLEDFRQTEVFPTTFEKDSHWNPEGAKLVAQMVLKHCEALGCLASPRKAADVDLVDRAETRVSETEKKVLADPVDQ
jgi:hypothetical protein